MENHFIDWDDILYNLKNEKTIVFLGPKTYLSPDDRPIEHLLLDYLKVKDPNNPYIKAYYEDGFFLFKEKKFRRRVVRQIRSFYQEQFENLEHFLTKLARIPFHVYINMTPDKLLGNTFKKMSVASYQDYYNMGKAPNPYSQPNKENPMIYNMLGYIGDNESLVLTHNDLFDYLRSIFVGKSMPIGLKEELYDAVQYIFLGLPFEKWYLQLLLRILELHTQELEHLERIATKPDESIKKDLFAEQFSIEFITNGAENFVHELYEKCEEAGMLREANTDALNVPKFSIDDIYKFIGAGENEKALNELMNLIKRNLPRTEEIRKDLLVLMNDFQTVEKKFLMGTDDAYTGKERNRIIAALLDLIDQFRSIIS